MKLPKSSTLIAAGAIALGLTTAGVGVSYAATDSANTISPMNNLVASLSQKFNLNQTEVQQVFDEHREQMHSQHMQAQKDRLARAVKEGQITQDQSDKISANMEELHAQRESDKTFFDSLSQSERKQKMQTKVAELKQWAIDNNIPEGFMPFGRHDRGHSGSKIGEGRGMGMHNFLQSENKQ